MWNKLGNIYQVNNDHKSLLSHASNPTALQLDGAVFRIYYCGRNQDQQSSVGYFDFNIETMSIVNDPKLPAFENGPINSFYSHGVSLGCDYRINNTSYLLFMAWQIRGDTHWRGDIGRLKLEKDGKLSLDPDGPFIEVDGIVDEVSLSYPWVIFEEGTYKMWYGSTVDWTSKNGEMIHVINYATSKNGLDWDRHGLAIPYDLGVAQAFSRPCIIKEDGFYHMWFSYRSGSGEKYRIGYAKSTDGGNWTRELENSGIDVSVDGWDSEMICYPYIFEYEGQKFMLYNGNGHGKSGIGIAAWEN